MTALVFMRNVGIVGDRKASDEASDQDATIPPSDSERSENAEKGVLSPDLSDAPIEVERKPGTARV